MGTEEALREATNLSASATGRIGTMLSKRSLSRAGVDAAIGEMERSIQILRELIKQPANKE